MHKFRTKLFIGVICDVVTDMHSCASRFTTMCSKIKAGNTEQLFVDCRGKDGWDV